MEDEITIETRTAKTVVEMVAETRLWQIAKVLGRGYETIREHIESSASKSKTCPMRAILKLIGMRK